MKVLQYKKYAWAIGGFSNNILDMDKRVYLVYMHVSPSGKAYIGRTKNYVHRSYRHQHEASCPVFKTAIDKYGWNRFTHSILAEGLTIKEANYMENLCILAYNTILPGGYNMTLGGQNPGLSEAARESIGAAHKGRKRSAITRARISAALTGRQLSPTHIANLSAAKKGHPCSAARKAALSKTNTGRKHTAEAKKKRMSEATKLRPRNQAEITRIAAIGAAKKGTTISEETRAKISASLRTPEVREKMRRAWEIRRKKGGARANPKGDAQ